MTQVHKIAAEQSKAGHTVFVVYVPDQGTQALTAGALAKWKDFVFVEAAYLNGKQIAQKPGCLDQRP